MRVYGRDCGIMALHDCALYGFPVLVWRFFLGCRTCVWLNVVGGWRSGVGGVSISLERGEPSCVIDVNVLEWVAHVVRGLTVFLASWGLVTLRSR